jgi:hypothetical protein
MIFAVTKLKQPVVTDAHISTGTGAIDMDAFSLKVIDTHQVLIECRFK